jgi:PKD repeat protein/sugar lactone lactonase YvrE
MKFCRLQNSVKRIFKISGILTVILLLPLSSAYSDPNAMPGNWWVQSIASTPFSIAIDTSGNIYVTEASNNRLLKFNQSGTQIGSIPWLYRPKGVAVDNGKVYIGCEDTASVDVYDENLNYLYQLGTGNNEIQNPNSIDIDEGTGKIYVVSTDENVVKIYNPITRSHEGTIGGGSATIPTPDGKFYAPQSIVIDELKQEILVLDHQKIMFGVSLVAGARVQVFDMNGNHKRSFGEYGFDVATYEHLLNKPRGVEVDSEGRIYVSDSHFQDVKVFNPTGTYLGSVYDTVHIYRSPLDLTFDKNHRLYVASIITSYVEIFQIDIPVPDITVTPLSFGYGDVAVGSSSSTVFTVQNDGAADLAIGTVTSPAAPFSKTADTCTGQTLIPAGTCTISIEFTPTQEIFYAGNFTILSNDPDEENISVVLNGTGINTPPTADAGGPYLGTEGQAILLDGSGSSDSDGTIVNYDWDLDNDGQYDDASGVTPNVTFIGNGIYSIGLKVTDNLGATDETSTTATIADTSPTAGFTGIPTSGSVPLFVNFTDNSTGYDQPLSYAWDFDDDGTTDSTSQNPSHQYTSEGIFSVKLTVTDADGSTDSLTIINYITVSPGTCANLPVWIEGTPAAYYSSLQTAYEEAIDGDTIYSHAGELVEDITLNRNIIINIVGGYDCDYNENSSGDTTLSGNLTISAGTNKIESFTVQ